MTTTDLQRLPPVTIATKEMKLDWNSPRSNLSPIGDYSAAVSGACYRQERESTKTCVMVMTNGTPRAVAFGESSHKFHTI